MKTHTLYLREDLAQAWRNKAIFPWLQTMPGEIFRDKEGRRTLRFEVEQHSYFLKYHQGVG